MSDFLKKPTSSGMLEAVLCKHLPVADTLRTLEDKAARKASRAASETAAPSPEQRGDGLLNLAILEGMIGDDWTMLQGFLKRFAVSNARDIAEMDAAVAAGDATRVGEIAHRIKGAAAAIGAAKPAEYAEALEKAGEAHDWDAIEATLPRFQAEMDRVRDYIATLDGGGKGGDGEAGDG
jgi:HPt (histidine-containing phosphotransfer) domain-containing protein